MNSQKKQNLEKIRQERITTTLNKIVDLFKAGEVPKAISIATFSPYKGVPSSQWSISNRMIMNKSGTSDARGFSQWKSVGRYPKKGTKAIHILAPKMIKRRKKKGDSDDETSEATNLIVVGFLPIAVFKYEDTEGDPVEYEKHKLPDFPLIEKAFEWGINVKEITFQGGCYGFYRFGKEEQIRLATPHESVFFHELSHAAHKRIQGNLQGGQNAKEEIVAELSAQTLSQLVGIEISSTLGNSYEYVLSYSKRINKDIGAACMSVISEVEQVLKLILDSSTQEILQSAP